MNSRPSLPTPPAQPLTAPFHHRARPWLLAAGLLAALASPGVHDRAQAATADLANIPLGVTTSNGKPNIMFILDDSGSMGWDYMPDDLDGSGDDDPDDTYGLRSAQCNGLAYNPTVTYNPPLDKDGAPYPNASYAAALLDGFDSGSGTSSIAGNSSDYHWAYRYYYNYTGTQPALNWTYSADGNVIKTTTFYTECMTYRGSGASNSKFTLVDSSTLPATGTVAAPNSKQNYANWFSYYRKRFLTMRTSAGRAFVGLDSNYRVGFTRINDSSISGGTFLNVSDFDPAQKDSFFNLLYSVTPNGGTPLRESLAKVGQYYGKAISGQTYDPMKNSATDSTLNSCRRNYALLSTDGYWNGGTGKQLNGSTDVGNQDSDEARPMKDSGSVTVTSTTDTVTTRRYQETGTRNVVTNYTRNRVANRSGFCFSPFGSTAVRITPQTASQTSATPYTTTYDVDTTTTTTVITTNGVAGAPSTSSPQTSGRLNESTVNGTTTTTPSSLSWANGSAYDACIYPSTTRPYFDPVGGNASTASPTYTGVVGPTLLSTTGPTVQPTNNNTVTTGGDSNSLADVAEYYYKTDLRTDIPNGQMRVTAGTRDTATHQHMTTFTLGLGLKGVLSYDANYLTQTSGDYVALKNGTKQWPVPTGTTSYGEDATHIDDLWHAAVNGRGQYFSAQKPQDVTDGLVTAFSSIAKDNGTGSAAATSSLLPVSGGEDLVFVPRFSAATWSGDLRAYHFTYTSGELTGIDTGDGKEVWSAKSKLDAQAARTVYFNKAGTLTALTYANLPTGTIKSSFDNRCVSGTQFAQCGTLTTAAKAKATGTNIISYLTGDRSLEMSATAADNRVFRTRDSRLGDIVNASPVYVAAPPFRYSDAGYATWKAGKASRKRVVYTAANDGMLHAFAVGTSDTDTTGGTELWAFTPSAVMSEMWRLADTAFNDDHRYFVDATPVVGDVYDGTTWRTILVGGLGKGGRSYYALDITNPDVPTLLWEITTASTGFANLGLTYGNPIITKLKNGTWSVIFSSGVNNVSSGDGVGRVYVANAITGAWISEVSTGTVGTTTTPSNLTRLNAWVDSDTNNMALRLYGGDMLGNFWRFDHDDRIAPTGAEATLMGVATTPTAGVQPITVKPALIEATLNGVPTAVVTFGTGRYLGINDTTDTSVQSIYVFKDTLGAVTSPATSLFGVMRTVSTSAMVKQTMNAAHGITTPTTVDWATKNGWFVDLDQSSRERISIDPSSVQGGTVSYASTIPDASVCPAGGTSYLYDFDLGGGSFTKVAYYDKMVVGIGRFVANANDAALRKVGSLLTMDDQSATVVKRTALAAGAGTTVKRSAWRELVD